MIQRQEYQEWSKHPVTVEMFHNLKEAKIELARMMIEGQFTTESLEATALKHAEVIGKATAIDEIIAEYQEAFKDE